MKELNITIRINQETKDKLIELKNLIEKEVNFPVSMSSIIRLATEKYIDEELYIYRLNNNSF